MNERLTRNEIVELRKLADDAVFEKEQRLVEIERQSDVCGSAAQELRPTKYIVRGQLKTLEALSEKLKAMCGEPWAEEPDDDEDWLS